MRPHKNLYQAMVEVGWVPMDARTHPRAYVDAGGTRYGTLEKDGVRMALSLNRCLAEERGAVMVFQSDHEQPEAVLMALVVDRKFRQAGRASAALRDLIAQADGSQTTLYLEPVPIDDKAVAVEALVGLYRRYGFTFSTKQCCVMVRQSSMQTLKQETR